MTSLKTYPALHAFSFLSHLLLLSPYLLRSPPKWKAHTETPVHGSASKLLLFSCSVLSDSVTPWTAARQASLSITNAWSLLKLMSIESVMPSNHLALCHPLLFLPSIFYHGKLFSIELALPIRWPKYWNFSFSISPSNEYSGLISFSMDWFASKNQTKTVPLAVLPNSALTK